MSNNENSNHHNAGHETKAELQHELSECQNKLHKYAKKLKALKDEDNKSNPVTQISELKHSVDELTKQKNELDQSNRELGKKVIELSNQLDELQKPEEETSTRKATFMLEVQPGGRTRIKHLLSQARTAFNLDEHEKMVSFITARFPAARIQLEEAESVAADTTKTRMGVNAERVAAGSRTALGIPTIPIKIKSHRHVVSHAEPIRLQALLDFSVAKQSLPFASDVIVRAKRFEDGHHEIVGKAHADVTEAKMQPTDILIKPLRQGTYKLEFATTFKSQSGKPAPIGSVEASELIHVC